MKRQLRVSGLNDYIAVDLVNDKGVILSTPFYLKYTGHGKLKYKDEGISRLTNVFLMADGEKLTRLSGRDSDNFDFKIPFDELLDPFVVTFI